MTTINLPWGAAPQSGPAPATGPSQVIQSTIAASGAQSGGVQSGPQLTAAEAHSLVSRTMASAAAADLGPSDIQPLSSPAGQPPSTGAAAVVGTYQQPQVTGPTVSQVISTKPGSPSVAPFSVEDARAAASGVSQRQAPSDAALVTALAARGEWARGIVAALTGGLAKADSKPFHQVALDVIDGLITAISNAPTSESRAMWLTGLADAQSLVRAMNAQTSTPLRVHSEIAGPQNTLPSGIVPISAALMDAVAHMALAYLLICAASEDFEVVRSVMDSKDRRVLAIQQAMDDQGRALNRLTVDLLR